VATTSTPDKKPVRIFHSEPATPCNPIRGVAGTRRSPAFLATSSMAGRAPYEEGQIVRLPEYLRALSLSIKQQAEGIDIDVQADELSNCRWNALSRSLSL
jgi:hypothetical protein